MPRQTRTICLALAFAMAAQPVALAQTQPNQPPAPSSQPNNPGREGSPLVLFAAVAGAVGAGVGLVSYAGNRALSSNESFTWRGTGLSVAGGAGGGILGTVIGGAVGLGIAAATSTTGYGKAGLIGLGAVVGLLAGSIFGGLWAGGKGDDITQRNASASSPPASGGATATGPPASTAAPGNGPGGASGALGRIITTP